MVELLERAARYIDQGIDEGPRSKGPTDAKLHEIADGIALATGFSHIITFDTGDGLFVVDTSLPKFARAILPELRRWRSDPVHSLCYTHGHIDHIAGADLFIAEAADKGLRRPRVLGHENVAPRFERYRRTAGYNAAINSRQFGGTRVGADFAPDAMAWSRQSTQFGPKNWHAPDIEVSGRLNQRIGNLLFNFQHGKGETDDHLWIWIPEHKALCVGDLVLWVFPNAGNPQKVQRYPAEWAQALREMIALEPELLLPSHGLPVAGKERIARMLDDIATALEHLVSESLALMNAGANLDTLIHSVKLPAELLEKPYMTPTYDEPEFVVRNIWRLYGGWYDGDPANLKPAPKQSLAQEIAALAGGGAALATRAMALAEAGELRLACHLIDTAMRAEPDNGNVHAQGAEIYRLRRDNELSLMARGIFAAEAERAEDVANENGRTNC